jgi:hypothetical protein
MVLNHVIRLSSVHITSLRYKHKHFLRYENSFRNVLRRLLVLTLERQYNINSTDQDNIFLSQKFKIAIKMKTSYPV